MRTFVRTTRVQQASYQMVYVEAIHLEGGTGHEHISEVRWRDPSDNGTGESCVAVIVDWIDNKGGDARVRSGTYEVQVGTVARQGKPKYLRTYADGQWTDNLLALPTY